MITGIRLENWKSHSKTEISLGDGTNVLVGPMGAGKSSVLDAITYALFGTLPAVKSRRIKLDDLIVNRPKPENRAEVEVSFKTFDGEEFVVKRVIERGRGTVITELRRGSGELIESGGSDRVTENVRGLLKIDYDLYERAIYSEQNRLDYFLTIPKGKRMDSIDELLGINKLENVRKGIGTIANRILARKEDLENRARELKQDESLTKLLELEHEIHGIERRASENQLKLRELEAELDLVENRYRELRRIEREISALNAQYVELSATATGIEDQIKGCIEGLGDQAELHLDELRQLTGTLEKTYGEKESLAQGLSSQLMTARMQLHSLKEKKGRLAEDIAGLEREIELRRGLKEELNRAKPEELEAEVERAEGEHRELLNRQAAADARIRDLLKAAEELSRAQASCPVCESPLDDAKKSELLSKRRDEVELLKKSLHEIGERAGRVKKELDEKRGLLQKTLLLRREVEELPAKEDEYHKRRSELRELEREIPILQARASELELEVTRIEEEAEKSKLGYLEMKRKLELRETLDGLRSKLGEVETQKADVKRRLDDFRAAYDESEFKKLEKRKGELSTDYGRLEEQIRGDRVLAEAKRKTVEEIRGKLDTIKRFEVEAKHLRNVFHALGTIQTAITKTQTVLRQQFLESVNAVMGDIWDSIYPYRDFVGIRLAVEDTKGGDYVLQLRDHAGNWIPVEGIASGGERTDAVLALRIAFAMALAPNLKWIVFDEPTHNLDVQGIEELAKIMRERLPDIVRQILLITHEEKLESAVSGYLYRFYRNKAIDEPTRVEQVTVPGPYD
jgi:exonuclease SbcC